MTAAALVVTVAISTRRLSFFIAPQVSKRKRREPLLTERFLLRSSLSKVYIYLSHKEAGMTTQNLKYIGIAGCALAILGAFLVWAKVTDGVDSITIKGTDSDKEGTYSLILAVLTAGAIWFVGFKPYVIWMALAGA